ncbi:hypothetical protein [uncultured Desulfovibrio sp.]|uniref:hypothetical protein n=1 Tax=uncultured Desulfovibrio sp. TaxID=167968 RepID=UPI00263270F9|nr:hypothetical protein [uncultured Desulfovibrio sp.]
MRMPFYECAAQVRLGQHAAFDAWLYSLLMDNNIAYHMNPQLIASPEQLGFMVCLAENQVYLPCSDAQFRCLQGRDIRTLRAQYAAIWRRTARLVREITPQEGRSLQLRFCSRRFRQAVHLGTILPTRLLKRMVSSALSTDDPWADPWKRRRQEASRRQRELLESMVMRTALDRLADGGDEHPAATDSLHQAGRRLSGIALVRHLCLALAGSRLAAAEPAPETRGAAWLVELFSRAERELAQARTVLQRVAEQGGTLLLLCDEEGGAVFDLALARLCLQLGMRVIYAAKAGFCFMAPTLDDMEDDPELRGMIHADGIIRDSQLSKNALLRQLRSHRLLVLDDGTREALNLHRVSVSFSRAWKEADLVLAKGKAAADILINGSYEYTRDILCCWHTEDGLRCAFRPHAASVHKFSEQDITEKADAIIAAMRAAHGQGQRVMFYSCIIGSIPGQTQTAIRLVRAFVDRLRRTMSHTLIINPAEHFMDGMDGDDLMYMWERVQRSGYIDIWRFQTVEDIEESFALLGERVPGVWLGKDATYSTGCTKEMRIALDMQTRNREMQIIGPEARMFMRRGEYGVGKYFDATIKGRY